MFGLQNKTRTYEIKRFFGGVQSTRSAETSKKNSDAVKLVIYNVAHAALGPSSCPEETLSCWTDRLLPTLSNLFVVLFSFRLLFCSLAAGLIMLRQVCMNQFDGGAGRPCLPPRWARIKKKKKTKKRAGRLNHKLLTAIRQTVILLHLHFPSSYCPPSFFSFRSLLLPFGSRVSIQVFSSFIIFSVLVYSTLFKHSCPSPFVFFLPYFLPSSFQPFSVFYCLFFFSLFYASYTFSFLLRFLITIRFFMLFFSSSTSFAAFLISLHLY